MLKNYILVAFRQFTRHKMFSALNVFCLAIGISFCLLIGQYILHESAINANLKNVNRQYFITSDWKIKNMGPEITTIGPLAKALRQNYPDLVANYYRFNPVSTTLSAGDKHFRGNVAIGDTTFISMYGLPLLYGNPDQAFTNNRSAVITENLALKLFGETDVIGRTVTMNNLTATTQDYTVSAVLKSGPYNTVNNLLDKQGYDMLISWEGNNFYPGSTGEDLWTGFFTVGYIELRPGVEPGRLSDPINRLIKLNAPETISKNLNVKLKPLDSYYLDANNNAIAKTLSILSLVALGILLLAIINFVNIMIGTSSYRIREIGLRKVFGGQRKHLIAQYLIESIVLAIFATVLSVLLYALFRPIFNDVLNTTLPPLGGFHLREILLLFVLVISVGVLAGIYPAFILSSSEVVSSVKGKPDSVEKGLWMRKSLLVLQFTVAIGVFIFSGTISKQVKYFFEKDLGYDKEQLMVIIAFPKQWDSAGVAKIESIRNGIEALGTVKSASVSFEVPERISPFMLQLIPEGSKNNEVISAMRATVDENYASTFGLHLIEGRFFRQLAGSVSGETVINESAMKSFGWKSAVGKKLQFAQGKGVLNIVGVVKDFHQASFHEAITPFVFINIKDDLSYRYLTVKLHSRNLPDAIAQVRSRWKELSPNSPFEYFFMDEKLQSMYQSEMQLKKAATIATGLMLLIVLLGIFGVLTLALTKRVKEIAVRRVLGAELHHILLLFIKQYAVLLLIANMVAWPLAWLVTNQWLQQFTYRIIEPVSIYFAAGLCISAVAILLISLQCLKVASANPVTSLKVDG
jgi:putative ABC transport system permease protein